MTIHDEIRDLFEAGLIAGGGASGDDTIQGAIELLDGDRVTFVQEQNILTVDGIPADSLAAWLAQNDD